MALTTFINLETHGAGVVGLSGIVDGNWARLDAIFDPDLDSGDIAYHAFWEALVRDGTMPTTASSNLEWDFALGRVHFHPGYVLATHATAYTPDTEIGKWQKLPITGTTNFQSFYNQRAGQNTTFILVADGSNRNLSFPAGWVWMAGSEPSSLAANKTEILRIGTTGTTDADVVAEYSVEA